MQSAWRNSALITAIVTGLVIAGPSGPTAAAPLDSCYSDDNAKPAVDDLTLSTDHVDVTAGAKSIAVTLAAHDDGGPGEPSGIASAYVRADTSAGGAAVTVDLTDAGGGSWTGNLVIPRWTVPGTWNVTELTVVDHAGLEVNLDRSGLIANDLARSFHVVSIRDHTPPKLTGFTFTPSLVDTRTTAKAITVTARVTDTQSGVDRVVVLGYKAGTRKHWNLNLKHTSGQVWTGQRLVPRWSGVSDWTFGSGASSAVIAYDRMSNARAYSYAGLGALGFKRDYSVISRWDRALPTVSSVAATPHLLDVRTADKSFTITVRAADVGSGVAMVKVDGPGYRVALHRVSGTPQSGTWTGIVHVRRCSAHSGSWTPSGIVLRDGSNPWRSISAGDVSSWPQVKVTGRDVTVNYPTVTSAGPAANVVLAFDERVNGITNESALLVGEGVDHPGVWTCLNGSNAVVDCLTGSVRTARFDPDVDLVSGGSYALLLDPEGVLALTDLAGNPFRQFYLALDVP